MNIVEEIAQSYYDKALREEIKEFASRVTVDMLLYGRTDRMMEYGGCTIRICTEKEEE